MKRNSWAVYAIIAVLVVSIGMGYYGLKSLNSNISPIAQIQTQNEKIIPVSDYVSHPAEGTPVDKFTLTAEAKTITLSPNKIVKAMTFNGTAPGPLLTVKQGDLVEVTVQNHLRASITVHWHGIAVPGAEDGVPGLTQPPIAPGATYVYRFIVKDPGTYWYHSHVNSVEEVGQGLYGGIVVLPKPQTSSESDKDYTLLLHEWSTSSTSSNNGMSGMGGMNMSDMGNMDSMDSMNMGSPRLRNNGFQLTELDRSALNEMSNMYDAFTVNQTSSGQTMLEAQPGQTVRLRLVNAGNMTHLMTLVGTSFRVVAMDGQNISHPTPIANELLPIGAAERYDIEFTMPKSGNVQLVSGDPNVTERMQLQATIGESMSSNAGAMSDIPDVQNAPWFDFANYGGGNATGRPTFSLNQHFDKSFNMALGVSMGKTGMEYTINDEAYPNVPPMIVSTGDTIKMHIENKTAFIHPMHLHGHDFQVLTRDGKTLTGSTVYLDTLEVLPGETYDIAFKADNPGLWMLHCHDLHHASAGMDVVLQYAGVSDPYNMKDMSE